MAVVGAGIRLVSLPLSLAADRGLARHAEAGPAIHKAASKYWEVASHPHAVREEVELAFTKLRERRDKALAQHDTSAYMQMPCRAAAMALCGASMGVVAHGALAMAAAAPGTVATVAWPLGLNPCFAVAGAAAYATQSWIFSRRRGFGDYNDAVLDDARAYGLHRAYPAAVALVTLFVAACDPTVGASGALLPLDYEATKRATLAAYLSVASPAIASAAMVGMTRMAVDRCDPIKRALSWPLRYPAEHGTYGPLAYSYWAHTRLVRQIIHETEGHLHADSYRNAKHNLECECDLRIQKMPIAKKFFRDTRFDRHPEEAPTPYKNMGAFDN